MNEAPNDKKQLKNNNNHPIAEKKNSEEQPKNMHKSQKRTEYPGFYNIEGEFSQEEYDRKTLRFNTKNKLHFEEATNNLKETLEMLTGVRPK